MLLASFKGTGITWNFDVKDSKGSVIIPGKNDKLRIRIMERGGSQVLFEVSSGTPSKNGSCVLKAGEEGREKNVFRFDDKDLENLSIGSYSLVLDYFDNADSQEWKRIDTQVLFVFD